MPVKVKKIGTLQIEPEAQAVDATFYKIQSLGLYLMCFILLGAFLGFFGPGLLGPTQTKKGNIQVSYHKYIRLQSPTMLTMEINSLDQPLSSTYIQMWISQSFFQKMAIKSISPTPFMQEIIKDKIIYFFKTSGNEVKANITLMVEPEKFGILKTDVGLMHGDKVSLNQFIYP